MTQSDKSIPSHLFVYKQFESVDEFTKWQQEEIRDIVSISPIVDTLKGYTPCEEYQTNTDIKLYPQFSVFVIYREANPDYITF